MSNTFLSVREAVINALIHADYSNESIRIAIVYDGSKIVITNPGTMRVPLDRALKGGNSNPRNQAMMRIAMMGGLVEYVGSGIHFINDTVNDNGLLKFSMIESGEPLEVKTTLWLPIRGHDLNNTELAILRYIEDNDNATQNRIAEAIGVSVRTVNRTMSKLKNEGILEIGGNNRNPKWTIRKT